MGPILFVIFINDLPNTVKGHVKLFADDTKLYYVANSSEEQAVIQHDLSQLDSWSDKWLLRFNAKKCKVIHYGKSDAEYNMRAMDGSLTPLEAVNQEKDLGIIFDCKQVS